MFIIAECDFSKITLRGQQVIVDKNVGNQPVGVLCSFNEPLPMLPNF